MKTSNYQKNKKAILKYQSDNPNYRTYRRKYEAGYRVDNKLAWNYKSWKSINKKATPEQEINYLLSRILGERSCISRKSK